MQLAQFEPYLLAGLAGWSLLFFAIGLWPFDFQVPAQWRIYYWPTPVNGVLNFLSFMPFGLLIAALGLGASPIVAAAVFCGVMSFSVEVAQLFLPSRYPSLADVALNTLGGMAGAVMFGIVSTDGVD